MYRSRAVGISVFVLTAVLAYRGLGMDQEDRSELSSGTSIDLASGAFITSQGVADLRSSQLAVDRNPALWEPLPVVPSSGWWFVGRGWQPTGSRSALELWRRPGSGSVKVLDIEHLENAPVRSYGIDVIVNGTRIDTLRTRPGRNRFRLAPPLDSIAEINHVELDFEPELANSDGTLPLSVLRVGLASPASPPAAAEARLAPTTGVLPIALAGAGTYVVPVDVPPQTREIEIELQSEEVVAGSVRVRAVTQAPESLDLGSFRLRVDGAQIEAIPATSVAGRHIGLVLEVEPTTVPATLLLERLRFVPAIVEGGPAPPAANREHGSADSSRRPDVLLIILDAARGDRFMGWDYPRPVLPEIAELGRTSLNFRNAFSECPTTSCSIPALITGRSFLPGGQIGEGVQLGDEASTLAEMLQAAGYDTIGFSATPNNSSSRNFDQGFDRFEELWGEHNPHHGPFAMSRLAAQVIAEQPETSPLFLQLHYLPPHQPYDPGKTFDRFTDPSYSGTIRPDMSLKPYSLGMEPLAGADLEQLVGLYDGNLLLADAAVGQVLAALEAAGRFDNTLIVITSDHGEAFMEHGRQGHNTTLFDEMLHIPLMIRLPGGRVPSVDTNRLASELDIIPTVTRFLSVDAGSRLDGIDLLDTAADPLRPRRLFLRTSHPDQPMVAVRTPRWKLIAWPQHRVQMLFDLKVDPDETHNLVGERPVRYSSLALELRRHLGERFATGQPEMETIELTASEREALRTLGYLD